MSFDVTFLTLFPESFPGILDLSVIGRARARGLWGYDVRNIADFGIGIHNKVDDPPAGGGAGMVMRVDVLAAAIDAIAQKDRPILCPSPRGLPFTQHRARNLSAGPGLIFLCGRFEGIDERVFSARAVEEVSLGDFVLAGGEVAAMAMTEACLRLLPGVLGASASLEEESFNAGLLEYPHYTRPREFETQKIPEILLGGDHAKIARWRNQKAKEITRSRRPDLHIRKAHTNSPAIRPDPVRR